MALEACKALMGCLPSASGPLGGATPPEDAAKDARTRMRAWGFVSTQVNGSCLLVLQQCVHSSLRSILHMVPFGETEDLRGV